MVNLLLSVRALNALNTIAVLSALFLSASVSVGSKVEPTAATDSPASNVSLRMVNTSEGPALRDAAGVDVLLRNYKRIIGGSLIADSLLLELAAPARVVAALDSSRAMPWGFRISAPHTLTDPTQAERLLALKPDLVLLSDLGDASKILRLRELGLPVFLLGPMRGRATLLPQVRMVAMLLGVPERGEALVRRFERRQHAIAGHLRPNERRTALYVGSYGDKLFGGTTGTSYSDVLSMAGLIDVANGKYEGWPQYSPEQVLDLDPDVIVTTRGSAKHLCRQTGLRLLRACSAPSGVVALEEAWLTDPGLAMLDAAESIFEQVYLATPN